jgi:hypothetical protein
MSKSLNAINVLQKHQQGVVLLIMMIILVLGASAMLLSSLNSSTLLTERNNITSKALAQVKEALIGDSAAQSTVSSAGYLSLPDLGYSTNPAVLAEGFSSSTFTGNNADLSLIGKVPWKKLSIPALRDSSEECLWYIVSGRFKNNPQTSSAFNWDTLGQIDVIDGSGNIIASNIAALLVAPGHPFDGQSHSLADPIYTQCGGNYDAKNYLDSYNLTDSVSGQVNYFTGSTNNMLAPNISNKQFVMTSNNHYNDQFIFITVDDIFRPIIHRSDFANQITILMTDSDFITALQSPSFVISGTKGTNNIDCNVFTTTTKKNICNNWKEMLLLTQLPSPTSITIDGTPTAACNRVLIFGGQKTASQLRITSADKSNSANYLEGTNLTAFASPISLSSLYSGVSTFNPNSSSKDLLKCIP